MISSQAPASRKQRVPKKRVITFYSYKGGTGRSMALANVAWMLAMSGERVLIVDWDLEAPGVHRYFHPFLDDKDLTATDGLLDFVVELAGRAAICEEPLDEDLVDVIGYIKPLKWPAGSPVHWDTFGQYAGIDLLVAGRQGPAYGETLNTFNWINFYKKLGGRRLMNIARSQMQSIYDYVLIDSRTGVSDTSGICTVEMPDSLVICFTLNDQSINGASGVANSVLTQRQVRTSSEADIASEDARSPLRIFPVPTRVEIVSERDKREVALALAKQAFGSVINQLPEETRHAYWLSVQLPYFPFYAFEEIPAVFGDAAGDKLSLSTPLRYLARYISNNPQLEVVPLNPNYEEAEILRKTICSWYLRKGNTEPKDASELAQEVYENCDAAGRLLFRKVMLRLVEVVAGSTPSLATVPMDDFDAPLQPTVQMLIASRLVQVSGKSAFLADRRIVSSWDLLRAWLAEETDFLLWRQRLTASARAWRDHGSDESALLRGSLLAEAKKWWFSRPDDLNQLEVAFITAAVNVDQASPAPQSSAPPATVRRTVIVILVVIACGLAFWIVTRQRKAAALDAAQKSAQLQQMVEQSNAKNAELESRVTILQRASNPPERVPDPDNVINVPVKPLVSAATAEWGIIFSSDTILEPQTPGGASAEWEPVRAARAGYPGAAIFHRDSHYFSILPQQDQASTEAALQKIKVKPPYAYWSQTTAIHLSQWCPARQPVRSITLAAVTMTVYECNQAPMQFNQANPISRTKSPKD